MPGRLMPMKLATSTAKNRMLQGRGIGRGGGGGRGSPSQLTLLHRQTP